MMLNDGGSTSELDTSNIAADQMDHPSLAEAHIGFAAEFARITFEQTCQRMRVLSFFLSLSDSSGHCVFKLIIYI